MGRNKKIFSLVAIFSLISSLLIAIPKVFATGNDLTNRITISNIQYSKLGENQHGNLEVHQAGFDFSGDWDATELGNTIKPNDYFTVPFNSKDENVTLNNGSYDLKNEAGQSLGTLQANKANGTLTFIFNENISGLSNVKGTFKVKASAKLVRGENTITYPDGTTQKVTYSENSETNVTPDYTTHGVYKDVTKNIQANGAPPELFQKLLTGEISVDEYTRELEKYATKSLDWKVRINYSKNDYASDFIVANDRINLNNGVVLTYLKDSFILQEMARVDGQETVIKAIPITTDKAEYSSANGEKVLLVFTNGGTAFSLHLGNAVGTKSYMLTYKTNVPEAGYSISNSIRLSGYKTMDESMKDTSDQSDSETGEKVQTEKSYSEQAVGGTVQGDLNSRIRVTKYDAMDATKLLSHATFSIAKASDPNTIIETITTNEFGVALSQKLDAGEYIIVETQSPTGYILDKTPKTITVVQDKTNYIAIANIAGETPPEETPLTSESTTSTTVSTESTSTTTTSTESTTSTTTSTESTTSPTMSTESTTSPTMSTESTTSTTMSTESTTSITVPTESTTSPTVSTESTTSPTVPTESTTSPTISTENTVLTSQTSVSSTTTSPKTLPKKDLPKTGDSTIIAVLMGMATLLISVAFYIKNQEGQ